MSRTVTSAALLLGVGPGCSWPLLDGELVTLPGQWNGEIPVSHPFEGEAGDWPDLPLDAEDQVPFDLTDMRFEAFSVSGTAAPFLPFVEEPNGEEPFACGRTGRAGSYAGDVDFIRFEKDPEDGVCLFIVADDAASYDSEFVPNWDVAGFDWVGGACGLGADLRTFPPEEAPPVVVGSVEGGHPNPIWFVDGSSGEIALYVSGQSGSFEQDPVGYTLYGYVTTHQNGCFDDEENGVRIVARGAR